MLPEVTLVLCLFGLVSAAPPTAEEIGRCSNIGGTEGEVRVTGWPMVAAVWMESFSGSPVQMRLSHANTTHTTLTLSHKGVDSLTSTADVVVMSIILNHGEKNVTLAALVKPREWARIRVGMHQRQLVVSVMQESKSTTFTSRTTHNIEVHYSLDTIAYACPDDCVTKVDLECLKDHKEKDHEPRRRTDDQPNPEPSHALLWPIMVVVMLLLLVCALYLTWRAQRKQIKQRRLAVKAIIERRSSESKGNSQADSSENSREQSPGKRLQYSSSPGGVRRALQFK